MTASIPPPDPRSAAADSDSFVVGPTAPPEPVHSDGIAPAAAVMPADGAIPLPRWIAPLAAGCAIVLMPWIVYLALTLPRRTHAAHYDLAWTGFDVALFMVLAGLALAAGRRRPYIAPLAAAATAMLLVDGWFDIVSAPNRTAMWHAIASAVLVEAPLAALCAWITINAERIRARRYARMRYAVLSAAAPEGVPQPRTEP